jgi:large subunit ribosomal protein L35
MKQKTNSGAKKRFAPKKSGLVKRRQARRRHLLKNRSHKAKRHLASPAYVHSANMIQMERLLGLS